MRANEIKVGGTYQAKVSGKLTEVRVDDIRTRTGIHSQGRKMIRQDRTVYDVTNLATGRSTTFESAMKFRGVVNSDQPARRPAKTMEDRIKRVQEKLTARLEQAAEDRAATDRQIEDVIAGSEGENCSDPQMPATTAMEPASVVADSLASRLRANVVRPTSGGLTPTAEQEEILAAGQI